MKKFFALATTLLLLLSSCRKDVPLPVVLKNKVITIKAHFVSQNIESNSDLEKGDSMFIGTWGSTTDYENPNKTDGKVLFIITGEDGDPSNPIGEIDFYCQFSGAKLSGNTYSGTGTWYIQSATGTLSSINAGAGSLTYKEVLHNDDDNAYPEYTIEMNGLTKK